MKFDNVKKILITHMHVDHVKSIRAFESKDLYLNVLTEMNECNLFDYYELFIKPLDKRFNNHSYYIIFIIFFMFHFTFPFVMSFHTNPA